MHPRRTIRSKHLTLLMIALVAGPVGCGLILSYFTRRSPEPTLPALVKLDTMWITPSGDKQDRRLVPCVSVQNPTANPWKNLSIGLNEQFYCQEPKGIAAGQSISLPLEVFVARNGSVRFPVGNREIRLVTVFAQIASGARAVSEHKLNPPKPNKSDQEWIPGE